MNRPLDGVRVIDMSEVVQGPLAAQVLSDYGATVIKVERGDGDLMRRLDREANDAGQVCAYFAAVNRDKRSICLNVKSPEGMRILRELIRDADVLIHSYRPEGIRRLGLSYEQISDEYPRLVYGSASGWGEAGPLAHKAGQDMLAQALSGLAHAVADPDMDYHFNPTATVDYASGMSLAQGILAALIDRHKTGLGQHVSVNLLDTAVAQQTLEAASILMYGRELNWVTQWYSGVFETLDGTVFVSGLFRDNALQLVCQVLNLEDLSQRPEFSTTALQAANKKLANTLLEGPIRKLTTEAVSMSFDSVDLLSVPLLALKDALAHPQVLFNDKLVTVMIEGQPDAEVVGLPIDMSRAPRPRNYRVCHPGEHTDELLAELGYDGAATAVLRGSGVVK